MKLESQVCTLEQAKKLKELGVKQKSYWFFIDGNLRNDDIVDDWGMQETYGDKREYLLALLKKSKTDNNRIFAAFTCAELGVMLNERIQHVGLYPNKNKYYWIHYNDRNKKPLDTEASARADYLIHLLESELITAEEVNAKILTNE